MRHTFAHSSPGVEIQVPWSISLRLANARIDQLGRDLLSYLHAPARHREPTLQLVYQTGLAYHVPMIGVYCFYLRILTALWSVQAPPTPPQKPPRRPRPRPRPRPQPAAGFAPIRLVRTDERWAR